jgi:uncharacterized membrane protein YcaP (DUF421 family)
MGLWCLFRCGHEGGHLMLQRDVDFVIFATVGSFLGAIFYDAGLSIWLVPPAMATVAVLIVAASIASRRLRGERR